MIRYIPSGSRVTPNCLHCGTPIWEYRRADASYCDSRCRTAAHRLRNPQAKPVPYLTCWTCAEQIYPPRRKFCSENCRSRYLSVWAGWVAAEALAGVEA